MDFLGSDKRVIGSFQLDDYQAEAVKDIYNKSYKILTEENKEQVLLHAPVGSGKTVMGAFVVNFFKRQMSELGYDHPLSFIWISPDTGGINEQSKSSFLEILQDVEVLDIQQGKAEGKIPDDKILFVNWEKLRQDGNLMKKETEKTVFRDILENTESTRVLIIDEAHINWATDKDSKESEVLRIIDADLIINLTATPDKSLLRRVDTENIIYISYETVQEAGVIKKRVIVNDDLDENIDFQEDKNRTGANQIPLLDVEQILLEKAIEKREYLELLSEQLNGNNYLKPLVLIQIPNANALENISKEYVYEFLRSKGIQKHKIGIWLANTKENIENLDNSDVEYLITKQAVATGWDCPRAHILVKLRETGSVNFDIQTLGRVMRIPRGYDYSSIALQSAYVYTPHETFDYKGTISESEKNSIEELTKERNEARLKEAFKNTIGVMGIPMYKRVRTKDTFLTNDTLYDYLRREIRKGNYIFNKKATTEIKSQEVVENIAIKEDFSLKDNIVLKELTPRELKQSYMQSTSEAYNLLNIEPYLSEILYELLIENDESKRVLSYTEMEYNIYSLFYNNKNAVMYNIKSAIDKYENNDGIVKSLENNYVIQEKVYLGEIKDQAHKSYSYDKEPDLTKDSNPEERFQVFLNNSQNVKYWFKNGLGMDDFSIVYEDGNVLREYYPDFIVFDYNMNVYILDTKSNFDDDDFRTTDKKYLAGLEYSKDQEVKIKIKELGFNKLVFSMIKYYKDESEPFILEKENYTTDLNDWTLLRI